jgi:hypothetical protein
MGVAKSAGGGTASVPAGLVHRPLQVPPVPFIRAARSVIGAIVHLTNEPDRRPPAPVTAEDVRASKSGEGLAMPKQFIGGDVARVGRQGRRPRLKLVTPTTQFGQANHPTGDSNLAMADAVEKLPADALVSRSSATIGNRSSSQACSVEMCHVRHMLHNDSLYYASRLIFVA